MKGLGLIACHMKVKDKFKNLVGKTEGMIMKLDRTAE